MEKFGDAISSYDVALNIYPCYVDVLYNKANCFCITKEFNKALPCIVSAQRCAPWDKSLEWFKNAVLSELARQYDDSNSTNVDTTKAV